MKIFKISICMALFLASLSANALINSVWSGRSYFAKSPMVKLLLSNNSICSAIVISRRTIITAAHCLVPAEKVKAIDVYLTGPLSANIFKADTWIDKIVVHPKYPKNFHSLDLAEMFLGTKYDIGLILLKKDLPLEKTPAKLYHFSSQEVYQNDVENKVILLAGFGATRSNNTQYKESFGIGKYADPLNFMELFANTSVAEAFGAYKNEVLVMDGTTRASFMCQGDSGGGVFFVNTNEKIDLKRSILPAEWILIGINSWVLSSPENANFCDRGSVHPSIFGEENKAFIKTYMK